MSISFFCCYLKEGAKKIWKLKWKFHGLFFIWSLLARFFYSNLNFKKIKYGSNHDWEGFSMIVNSKHTNDIAWFCVEKEYQVCPHAQWSEQKH